MKDGNPPRQTELTKRIQDELEDSLDEELEMELDDERLDALLVSAGGGQPTSDKDAVDRRLYFKELFRLQG